MTDTDPHTLQELEPWLERRLGANGTSREELGEETFEWLMDQWVFIFGLDNSDSER